MRNRIVLLVLVMVITLSYQVGFADTANDYTNEADMLNTLGLFNGTDSGYELDRVPRRVESAAMLVRLLGAEEEAKEMKYEHPFTDVPEWADAIVGYMYEKGFTKGIGDNKFGSDQTTIARDFTTFMLRSLGYGDSDFNYEDALNYAVSKNIVSPEEAQSLQAKEFKRNEMVLLSYRTLKVPVKNESALLAEKLVDKGVITAQNALDAGVAEYFTLPIKIWKVGSYYKYNAYATKVKPEVVGILQGVSSSNKQLDFEDKEFLAKYTFLTDYEKNRYGNYVDGYAEDFLNEPYYPGQHYGVFIFRGDDKLMTNYAIMLSDATEGEYNLAIQPVSEEMRNKILKCEEEFRQYKAEYAAKINIIPAKAYDITDDGEGNYFITLDRSKLPASIKNFKYWGQSGVSNNNIEENIDKMLKTFYYNPNAYRSDNEYVDGEPIKIKYYGYNQFTLLDENKNVIGITILEVE